MDDGESTQKKVLPELKYETLSEKKTKERFLEERAYAKVLWPKVVHSGFDEVKRDPCSHCVESERWSKEKWGCKGGRERPQGP